VLSPAHPLHPKFGGFLVANRQGPLEA
jgi:hypothetical protein